MTHLKRHDWPEAIIGDDAFYPNTSFPKESAMLMRSVFRIALGPALVGLAIVNHGGAGAQEAQHQVPSSIQAEHKELHQELAKAAGSGGETAAAAREVEKLLQPHFIKEEAFALPPLAALADLAAGNMPPNARDIIKMSEHLKAEMPTMLAEHQAIVGALRHLQAAAEKEHKRAAAEFAERLKSHAVQEEQILYPSAILVGEYLRLKQH